MLLTFLLALLGVGLIEPFAPFAVSLFTPDVQVARIAVLNLRIEIFSELFYAVFLIYHSLMTGAGHTWWVMASSFTNCILVRIILAIWFNSMWGIVGIFIACAIAPASSIPIGIWYTKSGHWRTSIRLNSKP